VKNRIGPSRTFHITSLGCAKNLVDSEHIAGTLIQNGWTLEDDSNECDLLIVNTCAFIEDAQRESIEALQQSVAVKGERSCVVVVAAGCLVQDAGRELRRAFPDIDLLIGTDEISNFLNHLNETVRCTNRYKLYRRRVSAGSIDDTHQREPLESRFTRYVKIADGCNTECAFCVIPRIRGPQKSLAYETVIRECERLIIQGARELILVAQDTTAYGVERGEKNALATLLLLLSDRFASSGEIWIRLLYFNPYRISDRLLDAMAHPPILPYFDLAIQHVSPAVLRAMSRPIPEGGHERLIERIRDRIPQAVLRATVMIGHPGEDQHAFEKLLTFLEFARFNHVGIFTYSPQQGTRSSDLIAPSKDIVEMRLVELNSLVTEMAEERFARMKGNVIRFIWDDSLMSSHDTVLKARSWMDAPDIDRVYIPEHRKNTSSSPFFWGAISGGDIMRPTIRFMQ